MMIDTRRSESYTKIISAGIIVFRRTQEGPRFLLLYRGRGIWDFARGRMEGGERSWQTAFREVQEETGLLRSRLKMLPNFKVYEKFPYKRGKQNVFKIVIFYLAETRQMEIKVSFEHQGYGWFSYNEARRLLSRYRQRQEILHKAFDYIRRIFPERPEKLV